MSSGLLPMPGWIMPYTKGAFRRVYGWDRVIDIYGREYIVITWYMWGGKVFPLTQWGVRVKEE